MPQLQKVKLAPDVARSPYSTGEVQFDPASASAAFVISTIAEDRDGDVLVPGGCLPHLKSYQQNPIVLFDHGTFPLPIGLSEEPDTGRNTVQVLDNMVLARCYFHQKTVESAQVCALVGAKVLRGASVGFRGHKSEPLGRNKGIKFTEWEMVEWSVVPIPANQEALRMALSAKWDGKVLAPTLKKSFKSLIVPDTKVVVPVSSGVQSRVKSKKQEKVMAEAATVEPVDTTPVFVKSLDEFVKSLKERQTLDNELAEQAAQKFLKQFGKAYSGMAKVLADLYPEHIKAADDYAEDDDEEKSADEDDKEDKSHVCNDDCGENCEKAVNADDEDDEEADKKKLALRVSKSWKKECKSHTTVLTDALDFLGREMLTSPHIPAAFKRQAKGLLPDVQKLAAWIDGKSEASFEEQAAGTSTTDELSPEEQKALAELTTKVGSLNGRFATNAKELVTITGKR